MKKLYLIPLLVFFFSVKLIAQTCTGLNVNYTVSESRCMATGSITATVTGGSGNYNYKVTGPVTTPYTVTNSITGLQAGYYTLIVKDITNNCTLETDSILVPGNYSDPRFQLTKTNVTCAGNNGTINSVNVQFGRSPFSYSIIAPSPSNVGVTNGTGNFTGLTPGEYYVQLKDSCGGIQVRRITIENYYWWIDAVSVTRLGCDSAIVSVTLKDSYGNVSSSGSAFTGFVYGVVRSPGDTSWSATSPFHTYIGTRHNLTIVVKDNCGNRQTFAWTFPPSQIPSVGSVLFSAYTCTTFTASVWDVLNTTNPGFCLYNNLNQLISCNATGVFSNLNYGTYCIKVRDLCYDTTITRCFTVSKPVPSVGGQVSISNTNCTRFKATITGQTNLISPQYCLYDTLGNQIVCNSTGVFDSLLYGSYCIRVKNGCNDTTIIRCFTVRRPRPVLTHANLNGFNCSGFNVQLTGDSLVTPIYCLYDSLGTVVACDSSGNFTGLPYGYYCAKAITACGDTTASLCFTGTPPVPSIGATVQITNLTCTGFTATITGQTNITSPQYCLYTSTNLLLGCNTTGTFSNIPYGSYCIKVKDGCVDTTIQRCFSQLQPMPSINGSMNVLSANCTTFTASISGTNLTSPQYCLYNSLDTLIVCNTTGVFSNIPFGYYCVTVHDGCIDTTFRVCQQFNPQRGITLTASKSCTVGYTNVNIQFGNSNGPFGVVVYRPDGTVALIDSSTVNPFQIQLPALPAGQQYKIIGKDGCNQSDSALITPDVSIVAKNVVVQPKCPTGVFVNGGGDLQVSCTSNLYTISPLIIKKDGASFVRNFSLITGSTYTFSDLEPAVYIVEYTIQTCNTKLYDTITVPPYAFPTQGQSVLYQCDNQGFSLSAQVQGGVGPYNYQIIGSVPSSPNITTSLQSSPFFSINTGTTYSLVRLRSIDACGNATLSDVSVLPLQNFSVNATATCFYQNIILSVDSIPNATYYWYRKTTPTDSVLLDSGATFNLPFFVPEEIGRYICKIIVHGGCMTRITYMDLAGCGGATLPVSFRLNGKTTRAGNQLTWSVLNDEAIKRYILQRKGSEGDYVTIGNWNALGAGPHTYGFTDKDPLPGTNLYRVQLFDQHDKSGFSNTVDLRTPVQTSVSVYPNPAKDVVTISFESAGRADYKVELFNTNGEVLYTTEVKNSGSASFTYRRPGYLKPGVYMVKIKNTLSGKVITQKIVFE
jgi:hypothetical protein